MSQTPEPRQPAPDPLVDEIRAIRRELSQQFGNDVFRLGRHLQEQEKSAGREIRQPATTSRTVRAG